MKLMMKLSDPPLDDMDWQPDELTIGPFDEILFDDGDWIADGEKVAEVFRETVNDRLSILGHPVAGCTVVPRTFEYDERDHPEYPGKAYSKVLIVEASS